MKSAVWLILLFLLPFSTLTAQDALSILESLPPPQVEYQTAPENSYPTVQTEPEKLLPTQIETPQPKSVSVDTEKLIDQVTPQPFKSLAGIVKNISSSPASETKPLKASTKNEAIYEKPAEIQTAKVKVVEAPSKAYQSFRTLQKNSLVEEWQVAIQKNLQLVSDCIELSQQQPIADKTVPKGDKEETEEGTDESAEEPGDSKSFDSVFAKVKGLQKKEKWKEIIETFEENPDAGETKEGLEFILEALLNQEKPDVNSIRRNGNSLLQLDKKSAWGNYAMAYYYYNSRKPNAAKGAKHLDEALKAKKPPPGASKLYWMNLLKKLWIVGLLILGAIIGGINHVIKKKKAAQIILDDNESPPQEGITEEAPALPSSGLAGKLKPLIDKLQPLLDKIRKKKPGNQQDSGANATKAPPEATKPDNTPDDAQGISEVAPENEELASSDQASQRPESNEHSAAAEPEISPPLPENSEEEK